jgi:LysM repeat protein
MTRLRFTLFLLLACVFLARPATAQTAARSSSSQLAELTKKIDEQNTKIDALSQQILKLQLEVGQMKGESVPTAPAVPANVSSSPVPAGSGATHVVTRGETLTSIAKQYKVGIDELQKFNHIENDRKLQIGQTLAIPGTQSPAPTSTPNE